MSLLALAETCVNYCLSLDPDFPPRLESIRGKTLKLEVIGLGWAFGVSIEDGRLSLHPQIPGRADLTVRGTPFALRELLQADDPAALVQAGRIELDGDVQLARQFRDVMAALDIDWEGELARYIGDWPAHRAGLYGRRLEQWHRRSRASLSRAVSEWLQEESRQLPARIEVDNFIDDVDALRESADRLEARVKRLQRRRGGA